MPDLTISTPVDDFVACADATAMRTVLGLGTAATATLLTLLNDFTYNAATKVLSSASTGASVTLPLSDATNAGLMAPADYVRLYQVPTQRLVGRNTAGTGASEQVTVDQLLDWVTGTPTQGDVLYRGASAYARLAPPAANSILRYNGNSSIPAWSSQWTIDSAGTMAWSQGAAITASTPAITISQTWNNAGTTFKALTINITNTNSSASSVIADFTVGGGSVFKIQRDGNTTVGYLVSSGFVNSGSSVNGTTYAGCNSNTGQLYLGSSADCLIARDAANQWAMRNGTNANSLAVYNTYTAGTPDYERLRLYGGGGGADFVIAAEKSGTGAYRAVKFNVSGINALTLATNGTYTFQYGSTVNDVVFITTASLNGQNNANGVKYQLVHDSNVPSIRMSSDAVLQWNSTNNLSGGSRDAGLKRSAAAIVGVTDGSTGGGAIELQEMTAPAAGATNFARIYAEDNGSGKTRIVVKFPTGAAQVLATEP